MSFFALVRSRRKSIALVVNGRDASLTVRAPFFVSVRKIEQFVQEKSDWIDRTVSRVRQNLQKKTRQYREGELFWYLGERYPLRISDRLKQALVLKDGEFVLSVRFQSRAKAIFERWYRREAKKILHERLRVYAERHGLEYRSVKINAARTRWGSCSASGRLNFSFRLVMAPLSVVDSVVAHELAHTIHHNHSRVFWKEVGRMHPSFERDRRWLKGNGCWLEC